MDTLYPGIPYDVYDLVKTFRKTCLLWTWVYVLWPATQSIPSPRPEAFEGPAPMRNHQRFSQFLTKIHKWTSPLGYPPKSSYKVPEGTLLCKWSTRELSSLSHEEAWKPWSSSFVGRASIKRSLAHHEVGLYVKSWMSFVGPWSPCFLKKLVKVRGRYSVMFFFPLFSYLLSCLREV